MKHVALAGLVLAAAAALTGCGGNKPPADAMKVLDPATPPPAYPSPQRVSLDPAAQDASRRVIAELAQHSDPILRCNATEAARDVLGADASPIVLRGLGDANANARFAACVAAGELQLVPAYPTLLRLAYDDSPDVRLGARFAMHRLGDRRLSQELMLGLSDPRKGVRANTVLLLGRLGEKSAVGPLRRAMRDSSPEVRLQASEALWRLGDAGALEDLVARSISKFPDEQCVAVVALAEPRDRRVLEHVRGLLVTDYAEVGLCAARAAGILGSDEGYGVATIGVKSVDPRQRALAALAFGEIRRADAQSYLTPLLSDVSPEVRLAAATALLKIGQPRA